MKSLFPKKIIGVIILIAILIGVHYSGIARPLEGLLARIITFPASYLYRAGQYINTSTAKQWCATESENETLRTQIQNIMQQNAQLSLAQEENEQLRAMLDFKQKEEYHIVMAHVVGKVPTPNTQRLIIDKGRSDGLEHDYPVITEKGVIVGKIGTLEEKTSQIILLNDTQSKLTTTIVGNENATGVLEGQFGLGLKMGLIPTTEKVENESIVITSGFDNHIPNGLVVGNISRVEGSAADVFQEATVIPPVRYDRLHIVGVAIE